MTSPDKAGLDQFLHMHHGGLTRACRPTAVTSPLVPRKVANELVRWRDLRIVELNYANKHLAIDAYWTLTAGNRRGHAWCRSLLSRAAARIAAQDERL
jgi:hypothetical protein